MTARELAGRLRGRADPSAVAHGRIRAGFGRRTICGSTIAALPGAQVSDSTHEPSHRLRR